jgi:hypothetical protein
MNIHIKLKIIILSLKKSKFLTTLSILMTHKISTFNKIQSKVWHFNRVVNPRPLV